MGSWYTDPMTGQMIWSDTDPYVPATGGATSAGPSQAKLDLQTYQGPTIEVVTASGGTLTYVWEEGGLGLDADGNIVEIPGGYKPYGSIQKPAQQGGGAAPPTYYDPDNIPAGYQPVYDTKGNIFDIVKIPEPVQGPVTNITTKPISGTNNVAMYDQDGNYVGMGTASDPSVTSITTVPIPGTNNVAMYDQDGKYIGTSAAAIAGATKVVNIDSTSYPGYDIIYYDKGEPQVVQSQKASLPGVKTEPVPGMPGMWQTVDVNGNPVQTGGQYDPNADRDYALALAQFDAGIAARMAETQASLQRVAMQEAGADARQAAQLAVEKESLQKRLASDMAIAQLGEAGRWKIAKLQTGLEAARLTESTRQFGVTSGQAERRIGLEEAAQTESTRRFGIEQAEGVRQFDINLAQRIKESAERIRGIELQEAGADRRQGAQLRAEKEMLKERLAGDMAIAKLNEAGRWKIAQQEAATAKRGQDIQMFGEQSRARQQWLATGVEMQGKDVVRAAKFFEGQPDWASGLTPFDAAYKGSEVPVPVMPAARGAKVGSGEPSKAFWIGEGKQGEGFAMGTAELEIIHPNKDIEIIPMDKLGGAAMGATSAQDYMAAWQQPPKGWTKQVGPTGVVTVRDPKGLTYLASKDQPPPWMRTNLPYGNDSVGTPVPAPASTVRSTKGTWPWTAPSIPWEGGAEEPPRYIRGGGGYTDNPQWAVWNEWQKRSQQGYRNIPYSRLNSGERANLQTGQMAALDAYNTRQAGGWVPQSQNVGQIAGAQSGKYEINPVTGQSVWRGFGPPPAPAALPSDVYEYDENQWLLDEIALEEQAVANGADPFILNWLKSQLPAEAAVASASLPAAEPTPAALPTPNAGAVPPLGYVDPYAGQTRILGSPSDGGGPGYNALPTPELSIQATTRPGQYNTVATAGGLTPTPASAPLVALSQGGRRRQGEIAQFMGGAAGGLVFMGGAAEGMSTATSTSQMPYGDPRRGDVKPGMMVVWNAKMGYWEPAPGQATTANPPYTPAVPTPTLPSITAPAMPATGAFTPADLAFSSYSGWSPFAVGTSAADLSSARRTMADVLQKTFWQKTLGGPMGTPAQAAPIYGVNIPDPTQRAYQYTQLTRPQQKVAMSAWGLSNYGNPEEVAARMRAVTPGALPSLNVGWG